MFIPVRSTALAGVDYDKTTGTLTVLFHNGGEAMHVGVPYDVVQNLVEAASPGGYYNTAIKGRY